MEVNTLYYYILEQESWGYKLLRGEVYEEYEDTNDEGTSIKAYRCIESFFFHITINEDSFDNVDIKISFGKDSYEHHPANNIKDFKASFKKRSGLGCWEEANRSLYEEFRRNSFRVYQKRMFLDLSIFEK